MRILLCILLGAYPLFSSTGIYLHSLYSKIGYVDYTSSRYNYESDLFGARIGSDKIGDGYSHLLSGDISIGVSGRKGQEYFSDRPFYAHIKTSYQYFKDIYSLKKAVLGLGFGALYNLEGILPGNLDGPSFSWTQIIALTLDLYSKIEIGIDRSLVFGISSPLIGLLNRPEWTGPISKEIEELYKEDFTSVLFKRGEFYTPLDYQSYSFKVSYKQRITQNSEIYIEEGITYSYTEIPRKYSTISNRFVFGINYLTSNY